MTLLQPRATSTSVPLTTFVATTVVIVLTLLAIIAVLGYLLLRQRRRAQTTQRTASFNRSASCGVNTAPRFPPRHLTALPSYPQKAPAPSCPPTGPSSLPATTRLPDLGSTRTPSPRKNPVVEDPGRTARVSPTKPPVSAAPSSDEAKQQVPLGGQHRPSPAAAMFARLEAVPLASDTTDVSTDTVEPGSQVVNPGYLAMLAQKGVHVRDHALAGSDDSTDAGGGAAAAGLGYAMRARGAGVRGASVDTDWGRGSRFASRDGRGRAMTFEGLERRTEPLNVRKMPSV